MHKNAIPLTQCAEAENFKANSTSGLIRTIVTRDKYRILMSYKSWVRLLRECCIHHPGMETMPETKPWRNP